MKTFSFSRALLSLLFSIGFLSTTLSAFAVEPLGGVVVKGGKNHGGQMKLQSISDGEQQIFVWVQMVC